MVQDEVDVIACLVGWLNEATGCHALYNQEATPWYGPQSSWILSCNDYWLRAGWLHPQTPKHNIFYLFSHDSLHSFSIKESFERKLIISNWGDLGGWLTDCAWVSDLFPNDCQSQCHCRCTRPSIHLIDDDDADDKEGKCSKENNKSRQRHTMVWYGMVAIQICARLVGSII